jgi:hypothetical protein
MVLSSPSYHLLYEIIISEGINSDNTFFLILQIDSEEIC